VHIPAGLLPAEAAQVEEEQEIQEEVLLEMLHLAHQENPILQIMDS
jgi:hypothetical protein